MSLRCFIAFEIPGSLKKEIGGVIDTLRKSGADVKWVSADKIHVTLKFLGSTEEGVVGPLGDALQKKLSQYPPFYIKIAGVGCFPSSKRPRVVWLGIEDSAVLKEIQREVDEVTAGFGYPPEEREFSPHLTIGRVRSQARMTEMLRRLEELRGISFPELELNHITLMKSELKPAGPEYSSLAEIALRGRIHVE